MATQVELFVKMATDAWERHVKQTDKLFQQLSDEDLLREIAPGRNRAIYLLGHLTAVNDNMIPLLGLGEKKYPDLEKIFLTSPDRSGLEFPSLKELRQYWGDSNQRLQDGFKNISTDGWFERHTAVPEETFVREPHRNKLNILINRTNHLAFHEGQLVLLSPSADQ